MILYLDDSNRKVFEHYIEMERWMQIQCLFGAGLCLKSMNYGERTSILVQCCNTLKLIFVCVTITPHKVFHSLTHYEALLLAYIGAGNRIEVKSSFPKNQTCSRLNCLVGVGTNIANIKKEKRNKLVPG